MAGAQSFSMQMLAAPPTRVHTARMHRSIGYAGVTHQAASPSNLDLRACRSARFSMPRRACAAAAGSASANVQAASPATLPGTASDFPIPEAKLIQLAQELFAKDSGVSDESLLADDFRFEFPVVSLDKQGYLGAVRSFGLKDAFPDLDPHPYDWRVDTYEPNRVWFTTRVTATHTGTLKFNKKEYEATGKKVQGAPECQSFVFNEDGKCTSYTGGYIMDRRVGNTQKMGALFGILAAIGVEVPQPGS